MGKVINLCVLGMCVCGGGGGHDYSEFYVIGQACQTQTIARAANWVLKLEKLTAGRSIEIHYTLSQFYTYFTQFDLKMDNILDIFHELLTVLSDSLF